MSPLGPAVAGGGLPAGAAAVAERLAAQGACLVSFGLCGGLDPALRPGTVIVPRAVLAGGALYKTDATLSAALGGWSADILIATESAVADVGSKRALWQATGAAAIDLESGVVAQIAARARVPFAVLRAVCDPADADVPPAALAALDARGAVSIAAVAWSLLRRPGQAAALVGLARAAVAARTALVRRVGDVGGGRFRTA